MVCVQIREKAVSAKNKAIDLMPALTSAFAKMELPVLRDITQAELNRVRKVDGQVSVFDVIRAVTGQQTNACRTIWQRLTEAHSEVATYCCDFKFNGQGQRETPVQTPLG